MGRGEGQPWDQGEGEGLTRERAGRWGSGEGAKDGGVGGRNVVVRLG